MNFPHHYIASAKALPVGMVSVDVEGLATIESGPPKQFGGSGEQWSPEDLFMAAVADCFVLSFKAIAAASKFEWTEVDCVATGTLDKVERAIQFTEIHLRATLKLPVDANTDRAKRLLEKAEQACLITNSLNSSLHLDVDIQTG